MNFLVKIIKKNVRPFKEWLSPLFFIKILLKTAQLLSKHFPSSLSLCILYFLFHKGKDTSAVPQPNVQYLVYVFINALITSKNKKQKHPYKLVFSLEQVFRYSFTSMAQGSFRFLFEVK